VTGIALLAFSIANPDARVARHNVERWRETGRIDVVTLSRLSTDAAPALAVLPSALRDAALRPILARTDRDGALGWNLSRSRGRAYADDGP